MVIKNPPKISPGLIFGGGLIIGMIFVLRIRGAYFRGGGLIIGILRYITKVKKRGEKYNYKIQIKSEKIPCVTGFHLFS